MKPLASIARFIVDLLSDLADHSLWRQTPADCDEANRSAHLDDIFYAAILGPYV